MASDARTVYKVTNPDGLAHIAPGGFKYPLPPAIRGATRQRGSGQRGVGGEGYMDSVNAKDMTGERHDVVNADCMEFMRGMSDASVRHDADRHSIRRG